ncbi:Cytochrome b5 isoform E [Parelaphostrongylus tenuis]|uniref:Cytochrome b5 n=1 Tax=Parelaphostrongylus tenuis TaxID=148309 RepID=A0AAD5QNX3_PARTN|nr:Cytochrome b5 isoform E [Parelaphostrongylus tenuis]
MSSQEICRFEVSQHCTCDDAWIIIHNDVIDVTKFLDEHPGGAEIMLEYVGCDATDAFESVGHSTSARMLAEKYKIGTLPEHEVTKTARYITEAKVCREDLLLVGATLACSISRDISSS